MNENKYFLPYQRRWLADDSKVKVWEKSRRIGATYVQSYEDVRDVLSKKIDVWFSSADESAAREYIIYCEKWTRLFHAAAQYLGEIVIDSEKNIKGFVIEFSNGKRISALSSSPKRFRSKGGKVVLDEFAWHEDQDGMWSAARPVITWGFPLRILSTHNGKSCRFFRFVDAIKKGKLKWALHTTTIQTAVEEGLVDKIKSRGESSFAPATQQERDIWLQEQHDSCFDENTWQQEYCCVPVDEATAFLTYDLITRCEREDLLWAVVAGLEPAPTGDLYVGMDIARKKHLSVIWGIERLGHVLFTRIYKVLEKMPFRLQREALFEVLSHPTMRRACIDATGIGMQLAEEAQEKFGRYRVEPVTFTGPVKEDLASTMLPYFEDINIYIPGDILIREDLHSVRKIVTASGNMRFDVGKTDEGAHADRFWALALAIHAAADKSSGPIVATSRARRESAKMLRGYE
jgi:phage FluMu gp28-like protein